MHEALNVGQTVNTRLQGRQVESVLQPAGNGNGQTYIYKMAGDAPVSRGSQAPCGAKPRSSKTRRAANSEKHSALAPCSRNGPRQSSLLRHTERAARMNRPTPARCCTHGSPHTAGLPASAAPARSVAVHHVAALARSAHLRLPGSCFASCAQTNSAYEIIGGECNRQSEHSAKHEFCGRVAAPSRGYQPALHAKCC